MNTLSLIATDAEVDEDEYTLIAALGNDGPCQYATFQRDAECSAEDDGIHFGFNDQINGQYNCISSCSVSRNRVVVELKSPIDWQKQYSTVEISLHITEGEFDAFVLMLRRIFRGQEELLQVHQEAT